VTDSTDHQSYAGTEVENVSKIALLPMFQVINCMILVLSSSSSSSSSFFLMCFMTHL